MDSDAFIGLLRDTIAADELFIAENKNIIPMDDESATILDRVIEAKKHLTIFKKTLEEATK